MSLWTAGQLISHEHRPISASIDQVVGDLPLTDAYLASFGIDSIGLKFALGALSLYVWSQYKLNQERMKFWNQILPDGYINNCALIYGDERKQRVDVVRGSDVPDVVRYGLFRVVCPILTAGLEHAEDFEKYHPGTGGLTSTITSLRSFGLALSALLAKLPGYRRLKFSPYPTITKRPLLMAPQGPVSNDLAYRHLMNSLPFRRYHIVAHRPKHRRELLSLTDPDAIPEVRREKSRLINKASPEPKEIDAILDKTLLYEIWESHQAGGASLSGPVLRPHEDSQKDKQYVHDAALIVVSPAMDRTLPNETWILSAQPLHPISTVAIELFWHPTLLLSKTASDFADAARDALSHSNGRGFEAVLKIRRRRNSRLDISPRVFNGLPLLNDIEVSVARMPKPLES